MFKTKRLTKLLLIIIFLIPVIDLKTDDTKDVDKKTINDIEKLEKKAQSQEKEALDVARNFFKHLSKKNYGSSIALMSVPFIFELNVIQSKEDLNHLTPLIAEDFVSENQNYSYTIDKESNQFTNNTIIVTLKEKEENEKFFIWIDRSSLKIIGLFEKDDEHEPEKVKSKKNENEQITKEEVAKENKSDENIDPVKTEDLSEDNKAIRFVQNFIKSIKDKKVIETKNCLNIPLIMNEEIFSTKESMNLLIAHLYETYDAHGKELAFSASSKKNTYTDNNIIINMKNKGGADNETVCIWLDRDSFKIIGFFIPEQQEKE